MKKHGLSTLRPRLFTILLAMLAACGSMPSANIALHQLAWCTQPVLAFTDRGTMPPTVSTDWPQTAKSLGFAPLLPPTLPVGTCLLSAGAVVHDPSFGSRFSITYLLPAHRSLSIDETPKQQGSDVSQPQCSADTTTTGSVASCRQILHGLDVRLAGEQQTAETLRALFGEMRAGVAWLP